MLKNCKEEDFYSLNLFVKNKLDKKIIPGFFVSSIIWAFVMTLVITVDVQNNTGINHQIWNKVIRLSQVMLVLQVLVTVFFTNLKNSFKYQRAKMIAICLVILKFSIEGYQIFFFFCADQNVPNYISNVGTAILIGGIVPLIIFIYVYVYLIKKGCFRKKGKKYSSNNAAVYVGGPLAFGIILIGGVMARHTSGNTTAIVTLICMAVIEYLMTIVLAKFFILVYCKFRFESFIEEMPQILLEENICWYKKPLLVLKSAAGWKASHKAPANALAIVYLEISMTIFIVLIIMVGIYRITTGKISDIYKLISIFTGGVGISLVLGLLIIALVLILLKLIKIIFKK
ncbi:hypothetical protein [Clostridium hydrogenum]|uniref:hypothetical protein n=1 Tax=Clostridium hydrogenum TaxID=2855764 RepID=UPI001F229AA4|nr:hypothetical protein [Clostridium hydrogenum]